MAKKERWEDQLNSASEEFNPSGQELRDEENLKDELWQELHSIIDILESDKYYRIKASEDIPERIAPVDPFKLREILQQVQLRGINLQDSRDRARLDRKIKEIELKIYHHFIPFIESRIHLFGWHNSPLTKGGLPKKLTPRYVENFFKNAYQDVENSELLPDEKIVLLAELNRLQEKFKNYQKEPILFNFEFLEQELYEQLHDLALSRMVASMRVKESGRAELTGEQTIEQRRSIEQLTQKGKQLRELVSQITDAEIKKEYGQKVKLLLSWITREKHFQEAPVELAWLDARSRDLWQRARQIQEKVKVSEQEIDEIEVSLDQLEEKIGPMEEIQKIAARLRIVRMIIQGKEVNEEDELLNLPAEGPDWAWRRLGIAPDASFTKVKRVYRQLAIKHHPDINRGDAKAEEMMKKINEAYGFIRETQRGNVI